MASSTSLVVISMFASKQEHPSNSALDTEMEPKGPPISIISTTDESEHPPVNDDTTKDTSKEPGSE